MRSPGAIQKRPWDDDPAMYRAYSAGRADERRAQEQALREAEAAGVVEPIRRQCRNVLTWKFLRIDIARGPWASLGAHIDFARRLVDIHVVWWLVSVGRVYRP